MLATWACPGGLVVACLILKSGDFEGDAVNKAYHEHTCAWAPRFTQLRSGMCFSMVCAGVCCGWLMRIRRDMYVIAIVLVGLAFGIEPVHLMSHESAVPADNTTISGSIMDTGVANDHCQTAAFRHVWCNS